MEQMKNPNCLMKYQSSINHIHDSSLIEILCKLPIKVIFQLKCISKQWFSVISNPDFGRFYISKVSHCPKVMFFTRILENPNPIISENSNWEGVKVQHFGNGKIFYTLEINGFHPKPHYIVGHYDGLILCSTNISGNLPYYIYNTGTQEIVRVQPSPSPLKNIGCGLICNLNLFSFVLIKSVDNYDGLVNVSLQVYFSEYNEWRAVNVSFPRQPSELISVHPFSPTKPAVPYKGMLHWTGIVRDLIIAYDPFSDPDICRIIDLPKEKFDKRMDTLLNKDCNVCEGRLKYFEDDDNIPVIGGTFRRFRVWVLNDYEKGEWVLEHDVAPSEYFVDEYLKRKILSDSCRHERLRFLSFHPLNKNVVYFRNSFIIVSYNVQTKRLSKEAEKEDNGIYDHYMDVFPIIAPHWPLSICNKPF